jgi:hypothetical protein
MRAGFRFCYTRALRENNSLEGSLSVAIDVGAGGEVVAATTTATGGKQLKAQLGACVEARAKASQFDAPSGKPSAHIAFDASFKPVAPPKDP